MRILKILFFFLLVTNSLLRINFSGELLNDLRIKVNNLWLPLSSFKELKVDTVKSDISFEFQDVTRGKVYKGDTYTLWNKELIYKDYITKVNSNLTGDVKIN